MKVFQPKITTALRGYTKEQVIKDIVAGIIVAIIALPLSIALAIASGVGPEQGLYTAIVAGFIIALLGGSRVNISGPTAAFATIVAGIVAQYHMGGLALATVMAGIILILMGICRFGALIKYIPYTITTGFTAGIAVTIAVGQVKDFLGLSYPAGTANVETVDKALNIGKNISSFNYQALLVGLLALAIQIVWPKVSKKIPGSLIAVIVGVCIVKFAGLKVNTIGDLYSISRSLPKFAMPEISFSLVRELLPSAFTIAILAAIESLLSCVVSDGMIGSHHNSNTELIAQGTGNIASAFFGGIPATGAIARTAANVKNGGRSPISGMVHAVMLLLILVVLMPYAALIPMPVIAAILFMVAYNMSEWRHFRDICKTAPKSDILVLFATFLLTVVFDLVVAIEVGMVLAAFLFLKRMTDVTEIRSWTYIAEDEQQTDELHGMKPVPDGVSVYEINGPMFFAVADKFAAVPLREKDKVVIIRMRNVPAMDTTGLRNLTNLVKTLTDAHITVLLSHVNEQPMNVMKKAGFAKLVGEENFVPNIDAALERASELVSKNA
ncbi:MAG: sulfate permease [Lachnospiraceae bacterium]|nr:sulfate permease [Lachnospiraceae bacterium]